MVFLNPQLEVSIIAIAVSLVSQFVQVKFGNKNEMMRHQAEMKKQQEKMKELAKSTHPDAKKKLAALEQEMLDSMNVVMKSSMRLMVISLVLFGPIFFFFNGIYHDVVFSLPLPIPWFSPEASMFNPFSWFSIQFYTSTNFVGWYVLNALVFSVVILNPVLKFLEKRKVTKNAEPK